MLEKFIELNKATILQDSLTSIDQSNANPVTIEREVYKTLQRTEDIKAWTYTPIAPLAEPVDLNELVGDLFNGSREELRYQAKRIDTVYQWINDINNTFKAELETVDKLVMEATDAVQEINIVVGDENKRFYWVSDSFNSNLFVDQNQSSCLIDTDFGQVTLSPKSVALINKFTVELDTKATKGIPGANLLVLNIPKTNTSKEVEPVLETVDSRNFSNLFDNDPSTWFEVERNFIPPKQKLTRQGRSFVTSDSGKEEDVKTITKDLDWNVIVEWPDGSIEDGEGNGISVAEFTDLNGRSVRAGDLKELSAVLAFDIVFPEPIEFSSIRLNPFKREGESLRVDSIQALVANDQWIDVVKDVELGADKSTTKLQREILRRTGSTTVGSIYTIPTDRPITRLKIRLSGLPSELKYGLAHQFQEKLTFFRTERKYVIFSSVDSWEEWYRIPVNQVPKTLVSESGNPKLVGSVLDIAQLGLGLGNTFTNIQNQKNQQAAFQIGQVKGSGGLTGAVQSAATIAQIAKTANIGGSLGALGAGLAKAVPYLGALLALDQLAGGLFNVDHTEEIKEIRKGFDVFKGFRASVGLRDLTLTKTEYDSQSVIQTVRLQFPGLVSKIGLFVESNIPTNWGQGNWITYYLSTDGSNWTEVKTLADTTIENSYTPAAPTKEIYFRAVVRGNPVDTFHTPTLRHFALQGLPV